MSFHIHMCNSAWLGKNFDLWPQPSEQTTWRNGCSSPRQVYPRSSWRQALQRASTDSNFTFLQNVQWEWAKDHWDKWGRVTLHYLWKVEKDGGVRGKSQSSCWPFCSLLRCWLPKQGGESLEAAQPPAQCLRPDERSRSHPQCRSDQQPGLLGYIHRGRTSKGKDIKAMKLYNIGCWMIFKSGRLYCLFYETSVI